MAVKRLLQQMATENIGHLLEG